jgi:hypothetical protein
MFKKIDYKTSLHFTKKTLKKIRVCYHSCHSDHNVVDLYKILLQSWLILSQERRSF